MPFSFDIELLLDYWVERPITYHHTAPILHIYALYQALRHALEESLEARWARHEEAGRYLQSEIRDRGFELLANPELQLPHLTAVRVPEGVDAVRVQQRMLDEHGIEIGGGLGPDAPPMWRIGLIGPERVASRRRSRPGGVRLRAGRRAGTCAFPLTPLRPGVLRHERRNHDREHHLCPPRANPALAGQTVVVIGGSAGIGLERPASARRGRRPRPHRRAIPSASQHAALELDALSSAAFDATDRAALEQFFRDLPDSDRPRDGHSGRHVLRALADMDIAQARRALDEHLGLTLQVARHAAGKTRPGGTLLFITGTHARRPGAGLAIAATVAAAMPALVANLALELAPVRVNLIATGFVDTPLSAALLGDQLDERRQQLRATLPIGRVVVPDDLAALAIHLMTNSALTGATYDIDGGQQLLTG